MKRRSKRDSIFVNVEFRGGRESREAPCKSTEFSGGGGSEVFRRILSK